MTPFQRYLEPARQRPGWWRVLVGALVILAVWILWGILTVVGWLGVQLGLTGDLQMALARTGGIATGADPASIMVLLISFLGIWVGTAIALRGLHDQPLSTVLGPRGPSGFLRGLAAGLAFSAISIGLAVLLSGPPEPARAVGPWLITAVPILVLIFFQAAGEELLFRGYLLQQLAARASHPIVWALLPSLGFGLMHYSGDLPDHGGLYYVAITTAIGLALAATVWRSGSLWPAAGLHVGINWVSLTVVGGEGILSGTQLWLFPSPELGRLFAIELALCVGLLLLVLSPAGRWIAPPPESPNAR